MTEAPSPLRQQPQQHRGQARIEEILGAAASVFGERGFDATTTNHIAAAAGFSVGTIYRWFPDKQAIADELVRRYVDRLSATAIDAFAESPDTSTPVLVRHVVGSVADEWLAEPGLSAIVAGSLGAVGDDLAAPLRTALTELAKSILVERVPGLVEPEVSTVARTCTGIIEGSLLEAASLLANGQPDSARELVDEACYAIAAYFAMKYPFEASHRWTDPMPNLPPSRPSTA